MKKEDIKEIEYFTKRFESEFKDLLDLTPYKVNKFRDYLGYGADTIYTTPIPKDFKETKWLMLPRKGILWITTDINPNGVTSKFDIDRTYTIKFEQQCEERNRYARNWHTGTIHHYYAYSRTIDEALTKFKEYLK